ncbi:hypothetical protein Ancab_019501 [Ancistrocladus abbreviatus]
MMSSPWARHNGVHVSNREKVGTNIWKLSSCSEWRKTDRKDGSGGSPSVFEFGCQKDDSKSSLPAKVGPGHLRGWSSSQDRLTVSPTLAATELCTQDRPTVGLASIAGDTLVAHKKRKSKSNSCKKGFIQKGSKGIFFTRPSKPSSYVRKSRKIKAVEGSVPDLMHNQRPSIDGGSIGDSVSDEAEIVARISAMEEQDFSIWQQQNASTTVNPSSESLRLAQ